MNVTIYYLIDPRNEEIFYVGRTRNIKKRLAKHNSEHTNKGTPKHDYVSEILKSGLKVKCEILEVVPKSEGKYWEEFYTQLFRSWGFRLLNNLYYKMGNQTSFQPGVGNSPVVGVSGDKSTVEFFESVKQAAKSKNIKSTSVSQSLLRLNKKSADRVWFYKEDYENMPIEDINKIIDWANTCELKANSGSFKKGNPSHNKVQVSEATKSEINNLKKEGISMRKIGRMFDLTPTVVKRVLRESQL